MLVLLFVCVFFGVNVEGAVQNVTCPTVSPRKLELKELDGTWYLSAAASDLKLKGDCAMLSFKHLSDNATDLSISWVSNRTASFYNGSAILTPDGSTNATGDILAVTYSDKNSQIYYFLDLNYEHYAVIFSCSNNADGTTSTYELWKLSRQRHLKQEDADKINEAIDLYSLQATTFLNFNNTEESCKTNGGSQLNPALILTSAMAMALFRRLY